MTAPVDVAAGNAAPRTAVLATVVLIAALLLGAGLVLVLGDFYGEETALAILVGVLAVAPVIVRVCQGKFDPFEPITIVSAVYLLYFSLAPLFRISSTDFSWLGRDWRPLYVRGLTAVSAPILLTWVGYSLPLGGRIGQRLSRPMIMTEVGNRTLRRFGWALTASAVLGLAAWSAISGTRVTRFLLPGLLAGSTQGEGGGPDIQYLFMTMEWFVPAFMLLCTAGAFKRTVVRMAYWVMVLILYLSIAFRYRLIVFVIAGVMIYYLRRDKRPNMLLVIPVGAATFVALGWVSMVRGYFNSYGRQGSLTFSWATLLKSALADTRIFETFTAVLTAVPDFFGHVGMLPFYYLFLIPIPRFLWHAKPEPSWIRMVGPAIGTPEAFVAGAAFPSFGEYYMALGWTGVVAGMLLFGILLRVLWEWYRTDRFDPARQAIFAICYVWTLQVIIRGYLAQIVMEFCFFVLPAIVAMVIARRSERRHQVRQWRAS
ncbi:MAG: hypothetical protein JWM95_4210 [Gemmatimonadetes bacterium]|nr:hypothetical protein [Gemmatimonadota bacterium]